MIKLINFQMIMLISLSLFMVSIYSISCNYKKIHPLILMSMLMFTLLISSFNMSLYLNNHWFSFLMFIIIIGGMMIIFLYFISFINNMKTSMKWFFLKFIPFKIFLTFLMFFTFIYMMNYLSWMINFNEIITIYKIHNINELNLNYMYIIPKNFSTLLTMIYLLISLTITVKICLMKKLTLRKFNYEKVFI